MKIQPQVDDITIVKEEGEEGNQSRIAVHHRQELYCPPMVSQSLLQQNLKEKFSKFPDVVV